MFEINNKKIKTISIDFDGVLLELFLGKEWAPSVASKQRIGNNLKIPYIIGKLVMKYNLLIREKKEYVNEALSQIKINADKVYLLTSRNNILRDDTISWIKKNKLDVFDEYIFNIPEETSADFKIKEINDRNIDLHIDDSLAVSLKIAEKCPNCISINLNDKNLQNTGNPDNFYSFGSWQRIITFLSTP